MKNSTILSAEVSPVHNMSPPRNTKTTSDRSKADQQKEPLIEQISSFVGFFIYLLVLKSFFLPLFIIPTGSMAETLRGAHVVHTCPNCATEHAVGILPGQGHPPIAECPNCRWREYFYPKDALARRDYHPATLDTPRLEKLPRRAGDRIVVHGWPYDLAGPFKPQRWDVVVFKVPSDGQTNYIKRLIGLPNENIELIDGDVYVNDRIVTKNRHAQKELWFPYYDHDHPPKQPGVNGHYHPRWTPINKHAPWTKLDQRDPSFDGIQSNRAEIQFVTLPNPTTDPGEVSDVYGYNGSFAYRDGTVMTRWHLVPDVRLTSNITIQQGTGYAELSISKYGDSFSATLSATGQLQLQHHTEHDNQPRVLAQTQLTQDQFQLGKPIRLAISNADYLVSVSVNGQTRLQSNHQQYNIHIEDARKISRAKERGLRQATFRDPRRPEYVRKWTPTIRIAAERIRARFEHLLIERDVYYSNAIFEDPRSPFRNKPGFGTTDHPIKLKHNQYFVLGDNSPQSLDARLWDNVGPHLASQLADGQYQLGVVPANQMIGPAFFVYWPGVQPLLPRVMNLLPDFGRIRWIR